MTHPPTNLPSLQQDLGDTAIVQVGRICSGKDPACETFCTNKGPKISGICTDKGPFFSFAL